MNKFHIIVNFSGHLLSIKRELFLLHKMVYLQYFLLDADEYINLFNGLDQ